MNIADGHQSSDQQCPLTDQLNSSQASSIIKGYQVHGFYIPPPPQGGRLGSVSWDLNATEKRKKNPEVSLDIGC